MNNILNQFKNDILSFIDELLEQCSKDHDLFLLRFYFKDQKPIKDVMTSLIEKLALDDRKLKKIIYQRNETQFLDSNLINYFDMKYVTKFKKFWHDFDQQTKNVVWDWLIHFCNLSDQYLTYINEVKEKVE
jgi:hypothetical protein